MEQDRRAPYERNRGLEDLLRDLSELLAPAERLALARQRERAWPVVLVIGPPRSGTTLAMQWLAASGAFGYPTNLLSRFYAAPAIGARVQELLTNPRYAFRDELAGLAREVDFTSDLGKTRGALAPNEFWYFWRRFLPTVDIEPLGERAGEVDVSGLNAELAALADVFEKPLALKGLMLMYDLPAAAAFLPDAIFLHLERDPLFNAQSLLEARERFFGDRARWYSARPPEAAELERGSPFEQIAGQVVHTQRHIADGLRAVDPTRKLSVSYAGFCADPAATWSALGERLAARGCPLPGYDGPPRFEATDTPRLAPADLAALRAALDALEPAAR
jgi:hypothetical protein